MSKQMEYITLRRNGRSLYMRVPPEYVRANQLEPGDIAVWWPGEKIRIIKKSQMEELANEAAELQAAAS
jgi:hypothetical protein